MRWQPESADLKVGSFLPGLAWAVEHTLGPVLELGGGYFSTPYLHDLVPDRLVLTYEFDPEWRELLDRRFGRSGHRIISDPKHVPTHTLWSVVLIDCEGWERLNFFHRLEDWVEVFVIHDSQDSWIPESEYDRFQYRYDFDMDPRTTLVSKSLPVGW